MAGRPRKLPDKRVNRSTADLAVLPGATLVIPDPPSTWLAVTRDAWAAMWTAEWFAGSFDMATGLPALVRLFDLRDTRERYAREARKQPLVTGSTGQPVLNPLGKAIPTLDTEIRQLEDRFGLNSKGRLGLGISTLDTAKRLADLTFVDDDEDADAERFHVIDTTGS